MELSWSGALCAVDEAGVARAVVVSVGLVAAVLLSTLFIILVVFFWLWGCSALVVFWNGEVGGVLGVGGEDGLAEAAPFGWPGRCCRRGVLWLRPSSMRAL